MCDLSYHHNVHSYAVCMAHSHLWIWCSLFSYHCEAHSISLRVWGSLTLELPLWDSQLPTDMMLTFTLWVWDSQLYNRLKDTHTHIYNWVTTVRFTHNYATCVRLTITQWFKAHSYSYLSYYHEAHSQLCNGCEAHLQVHNGLRHTHSYLSYHHEAHSQ